MSINFDHLLIKNKKRTVMARFYIIGRRSMVIPPLRFHYSFGKGSRCTDTFVHEVP